MSTIPSWAVNYAMNRINRLGTLTTTFRVSLTTFVTLLVYAAIFISSVVIYEGVPEAPAPSRQLGLNLTAAVHDLQVIANSPHPYNSHANDVVRSYILSRLTEIATLRNNIHIADDILSNATWYSGAGVYFEGNNILVKIDGKQPDLEAVLFSAHFDSVSTAFGATDDGMGVVTLLQLVGYFADNTPKRTVIFNINNAEEDGLMGAHAFLEHPWSSLPKLFLNLEGAGAGGRPLLFRTSSLSVTQAFINVPHPHGSVASSDAFARGLVRSGTDFSVYQTEGMRGLDLAFYKRRSLYHTKKDSVPSLGGTNSLWAMMESALMSGIALTETISVNDADEPAVYYDLFGMMLVVYPLQTLFNVQIESLIVGAILMVIGIYFAYSREILHWSPKQLVRLPLAFLLGIALPLGLAALFTYMNPYIVYSSGYTVFISLISLAFLAIYIPLAPSIWKPEPQQKSIAIFETYILWYILLAFNTVLVYKKIGGLYVVFYFHILAFGAVAVTTVEYFDSRRAGTQPLTNPDAPDDDDEREDDHTETSPLIHRRRNDVNARDVQDGGKPAFWMAQYLLLVPYPVILVTQMGVLVLGALPQTLADGNPALLVYLALALLSFLFIFPIAPFAHKLHRYMAVGFLLLFLGTGIYNLVAFPFSTASPLKVFFYQSVNLETGSNLVNLTGLPGYIDKHIIPSFPSTLGQSIECSDSDQRRGLRTCQWEGLPPAVVTNRTKDWLSFSTSLIAPRTALIKVKGMDTRSCKVYFDNPVTSVHVEDSTEEVQRDYPFPPEGISELRVWSRTWNKEFTFTVTWKEQDALTGRVSCGWAETSEDRIPAFTEVVGYLPSWVLVTKMSDALVEGMRNFTV